MNITQQSLDHLTQDSTSCSIASDQEKTPSEKSSNSSSPKPTLPCPVFQALKGYSLFKLDGKIEAIIAFLRLSSYDTIFTSGNLANKLKIEALTEEPKLLLKTRRNSSKMPSKWTSHFCAQFICDAVELMEQDLKVSKERTGRKSARNKNSSLPPAASKLIRMVEEARLKVRSETVSRKQKTTSRVKTVQDYLLKSTVHNPKFVEITPDQILDHLLI